MSNIVYTGQITIDGDATPDPITVPVDCRKITIRPDLDNVMNGYLVYAPTISQDPFELQDGEQFTFEAETGSKSSRRGIIPAGTVVGKAKANTVGSWIFDVKCEL